jgi:hypothetical protein
MIGKQYPSDEGVDARIKTPDAKMPLLHVAFEGRVVEHNSSFEYCVGS